MTHVRSFEDWMERVNAALEGVCGLSSEDLADCCYRDWYDDGTTPGDAAIMALEENDY